MSILKGIESIWIVGANGLVGRTLTLFCKSRNIDFIATGRKETDITELSLLREFVKGKKISHIINCAAFTQVDLAEKELELLYAVNAKGVENLSILALECNAKLLHLSTDYVFNGRSSTPYVETDLCNPISAYGKSKREGELKILEINPSSCILRTSWLFEKDGKNFISGIFGLMQKQEEVKVVSDQIGKPTACRDLASAILDLLPYSGIFHFANRTQLSRYQIALDIYEMARKMEIPLKCHKIIPVLSSEFPTLAPRPSFSSLSTAKFEATLGKQPREWAAILHEFLQGV